ncbi:hypothetical protein ACWD1W_41545 [Streptomyces olivaceoviridis]
MAGVLAFAGAGATSAQAVAPWGPAGVPTRVAEPGAVTRPSSDHIIRPRATICRNQAWTSGNGRAALRMQEDGNFVLYKDGRPVWQAPNTWSRGNCAVFQEDGNFVVYDSSGNPVWAADTWHKGAYLAVQDDGNVVVYDNAGRPVWATNTGD